MTEDQKTIDAYEVSPLPEYKCHKTVKAFKIGKIEVAEDGSGAILTPEDTTLKSVRIDRDFIFKHSPFVGGYYKLYENCYESYESGGVFEAGHDRIGSIKEMPKK